MISDRFQRHLHDRLSVASIGLVMAPISLAQLIFGQEEEREVLTETTAFECFADLEMARRDACSCPTADISYLAGAPLPRARTHHM